MEMRVKMRSEGEENIWDSVYPEKSVYRKIMNTRLAKRKVAVLL
jgi:hypothetical protein